VGVEPAASPVITQTFKGEAIKPGPHKIQGIGAGLIPETLDLAMVDRVETVSNEEAIEMARGLLRKRVSFREFRAAPPRLLPPGLRRNRSSKTRRLSLFSPIQASGI